MDRADPQIAPDMSVPCLDVPCSGTGHNSDKSGMATTKTATLQNGDNSGQNGDNSSQNGDNH